MEFEIFDIVRHTFFGVGLGLVLATMFVTQLGSQRVVQIDFLDINTSQKRGLKWLLLVILGFALIGTTPFMGEEPRGFEHGYYLIGIAGVLFLLWHSRRLNPMKG